MEEIHFLVDELQVKLDHEIRSVLELIRDPKAKERVKFVHSFTRELVRAAGKEKKNRKEQPLFHSTLRNLHNFPQQKHIAHQQPQHQQHQQDHQPVFSPYYTQQMGSQQPQPVPQQVQPPKEASPVDETLEFPAEQPTLQNSQVKEEVAVKPMQPSVQQAPSTHHQPPQKVSLIKESQTKQTVVAAEIKEGKYLIAEPYLSEQDKQALVQSRKEFEQSPEILKDKKKTYKILKKVMKQLKVPINDGDETQFMSLRYYLVRNIANLGQLEPLVHDDKITKIVCEGVQLPLKIIRNGEQLLSNVVFAQQETINSLLLQIAQKTYQQLSMDEPILDATFKEWRVQGTLGSSLVPAKFIMSKE